MTMLPRGWGASTVDYTIKLIAPAAGEKLVARGRLVRAAGPCPLRPPTSTSARRERNSMRNRISYDP